MKITKYTIVVYACGNSRTFGPFDVILRCCPFCGRSAVSVERFEEAA